MRNLRSCGEPAALGPGHVEMQLILSLVEILTIWIDGLDIYESRSTVGIHCHCHLKSKRYWRSQYNWAVPNPLRHNLNLNLSKLRVGKFYFTDLDFIYSFEVC